MTSIGIPTDWPSIGTKLTAQHLLNTSMGSHLLEEWSIDMMSSTVPLALLVTVRRRLVLISPNVLLHPDSNGAFNSSQS
jgi:hypothetical protein